MASKEDRKRANDIGNQYITDEEFNHFLGSYTDMVRTFFAQEESDWYVPCIVALGPKEEQGFPATFIMVPDITMGNPLLNAYRLGAELAGEKYIVCAFFAVLGNTAQVAAREGEEYKDVLERASLADDLGQIEYDQEVICVMGTTMDLRSNGATIPIRRDENNFISTEEPDVYLYDSSKPDAVLSGIMRSFFRGHLEAVTRNYAGRNAHLN